MMQTEVTAKIAKTTVDAKKATVTLELEYESWGQIPTLARITGQIANVVIYPSQTELGLDDE